MAGLRAFCYSQVTYVTASMLANSLPKTDLRIVQVGGGIKELYYYPSTTVQVCTVMYHSRPRLRVSAALSGYQAWQRSIANATVLETCRCMELQSHSATLSAPGVLPADMRVYAVPVTPAHSVKQLDHESRARSLLRDLQHCINIVFRQIMQDGAVARRRDAPFYEPAAHSQPVRSPQNTHGLGACKTFAQLGLRHKVTRQKKSDSMTQHALGIHAATEGTMSAPVCYWPQ